MSRILMCYYLYSLLFYIKAILLSLIKVKVKIEVCKKSIDHFFMSFCFDRAKVILFLINTIISTRKIAFYNQSTS